MSNKKVIGIKEELIDEILNGFFSGGAVRAVRRQQLAERAREEERTFGDKVKEREAELGEFNHLYDALLDEAGFAENDVNRELLKKKLNHVKIKDKWRVYENNFMWQGDVKVFGPDVWSEQGIGLLVYVDASTRRCDAEPIYDIDQQQAILATVKILNRQIIAPSTTAGRSEDNPKIIYTDQGSEFADNYTRQLNAWNIKHRYSYPGRKGQTSIVEHVISLIAFGLMSNLYRLRVIGMRGNRVRQGNSIDVLGNGILERVIAKINKWASMHFPKPTKEWSNFITDLPVNDLTVGDWVLTKKVKTDRIRNRSGQHMFSAQPQQVIAVYTPTLKKQPYRYLTTLSLDRNGKTDLRKMITFKRDELIKLGENGKEVIDPVIEFS